MFLLRPHVLLSVFVWLFVLPAQLLLAKPERIYERGYTKQEKETLSWIIKKIAWDDIVSIGKNTFKIIAEGKKLDSLHPLRFCEIIFTDELLKCGAHAIRQDRTKLIQDRFYYGIIDSLEEESAVNNLKIEYIKDFAKNVKIKESLILPLLQQKKWKGFVDCLIDNIPRKNNPERYNI